MDDDLITIAKDTRRVTKDARSAISNLDYRLTRLTEARALHRPGGLCARLAACQLMARLEKRQPADVAKQHYGGDRELGQWLARAAVAPAQTTVAGWASELAAVVVADVADSLLPQTALAQLRSAGLSYGFVDGAVVRVPTHAPAPSGGFVLEAGAIPVGALLLSSFTLKPKKAAGIVAVTRELLAGSPINVELSLKTLLSQDIGLMIDNVLLSNAAATAAQPAGLLTGLSSLSPTAGGGVTAMLADIKKLLAAIAPAIRPVLIMNTTQGSSTAILEPPIGLPAITAPYLAADTVICIDAAQFASALGPPDFNVSEEPAIHMESAAPLPIASGPQGSAVLASPTSSLWQTASVGLRTILDVDWALRRTNAVSYMSGVSW